MLRFFSSHLRWNAININACSYRSAEAYVHTQRFSGTEKLVRSCCPSSTALDGIPDVAEQLLLAYFLSFFCQYPGPITCHYLGGNLADVCFSAYYSRKSNDGDLVI